MPSDVTRGHAAPRQTSLEIIRSALVRDDCMCVMRSVSSGRRDRCCTWSCKVT